MTLIHCFVCGESICQILTDSVKVSILELKRSIKMMNERDKYFALYNSEVEKNKIKDNMIDSYKREIQLLNERVDLIASSWLDDILLIIGAASAGFLIGVAVN